MSARDDWRKENTMRRLTGDRERRVVSAEPRFPAIERAQKELRKLYKPESKPYSAEELADISSRPGAPGSVNRFLATIEARDAEIAELNKFFKHHIRAGTEEVRAERDSLRAELDTLRGAVERISERHPKVLGYIRKHGFVFEDIGNEPGNWQHLAFSIYTDLCEVDSIARAALNTGDVE